MTCYYFLTVYGCLSLCDLAVSSNKQVTILALQQIFSRFGKVNKIVMFDKGSGFQALVQMNDVHTAMNAHEAADMQVCYTWTCFLRFRMSYRRR